ncbi:MAG TPA: heparan-alpha-glucosaminide N-acetyltransferase domain-containing protein [Gemmatimonadaceae bacterium]|jgi:uncharacterized membrane protein|nr:heparan-alpha-glucosaminide N-acetyltransferase domain-containing protein [Gemmatimonadaceae bacterium]
MALDEKQAASTRITSIDVVRGLVMVLMAIDHVRVYSGQPAGGPTPGIFFTRWVTHFVAPAFVFFAGTGAYLHGAKLMDRGKLAKFLVSRGLWLVVLELTFLRFAWTFNFDYAHYSLAGVIWMLGWCMVILAGIIYLPMSVIATFGIVTIIAHPVLYSVLHAPQGSFLDALFQVLYLNGGFSIVGADGPPMLVLFVIIPWIGVMAAGYAFGPVMQWDPARRRAFCLRLGVGATALFVALRALDGFGDPRHWHDQITKGWPPLLAFLNTSKYPASFLFLLMTLGPTITLLPFVESAHGWLAQKLETFGRVPLFYYILHIPLIHLAAVAVSLIRTGAVSPWLFANHPVNPGPQPAGYMWGLPLLYFVWAIVVVILYFPCRWYAALKARNKNTRLGTYLSYL